MNETQCSQLIEGVEWTLPRNLISLAILGFIDILVVVGNCLVIAAVFCSQKLRSVTNFFIGMMMKMTSIKV
jgi:octopamine receptor